MIASLPSPAPPSRGRRSPMQRDFARLRAVAEEIVRQCDHYARNTAEGADDSFRGAWVRQHTAKADAIAKRMERRYDRAKREASK